MLFFNGNLSFSKENQGSKEAHMEADQYENQFNNLIHTVIL